MDRYLVLLIGNIASGKSTISKKFSKIGFSCVSSDGIRYMLHPDEYVFNPEEEYAVHSIESAAIKSLMDLGFDVLVDDAGNSILNRRKWMMELAELSGYKVVAVIMPTLSKSASAKRRLRNNHGGYDKKRWEEVYEMFQKTNCPPTKKEGFHAIYRHNSSSLDGLLEVVKLRTHRR